MKISKSEWDKYVGQKRDLIHLERELEDVEERVLAVQKSIFAVERRGIIYDVERGMICFPGSDSNKVAAGTPTKVDPLELF